MSKQILFLENLFGLDFVLFRHLFSQENRLANCLDKQVNHSVLDREILVHFRD